MKLGNYIVQTEYGSNVILYNTYNGAIIELTKNQIVQDNLVNLAEEEIVKIKQLGFTKNFSKKELLNLYNKPLEVMNITVELTKNCNLKCAYCYQRQWDKKNKRAISFTTLDKIKSLCNLIYNRNINFLTLSFIGGEPLLELKKLLYCYKKIKNFADANNLKLFVFIDTNGTIYSDKIKIIENLYINITISTKKDHNKYRNALNPFDCYSLVLSNILKYENLLTSSQVSLRYNVNGENYKDLELHIKNLLNSGLKSKDIDLAYTVDYNEFKNTLSRTKYYKWLYTKAYEILYQHGFSIRYFPTFSFYPCSAYSKNSIKVHCDGKISLCDSWDINKANFTIDDLLKNYQNFINTYEAIKRYSPLDLKKCKSCKYLLICGGQRFCDKNPCLKYRYLKDLLITYKKTCK